MRCRHFGDCGGCSLPGTSYGEQLAGKRARLHRLLGLPVEPVLPSPQEEHFRHKVAFVFSASRGGRGFVMGHYAAGSRRVVPIEECPVHGERANRIAFGLRDALARSRVDARLLRHVVIRTSSDDAEAVAMLVVRRNDRALRAPVRAFLDSPERPDGFFVNVHDRPDPYLVGKWTVRIQGRGHVRERGLGPSFLISPTAFFQPNVGAAAGLLRTVLAGVGDAETVWDLYGGVGLFTVPLAAAGARVTTVEENRQAIEDLGANLRLNDVPADRVRRIPARVEDAVGRLSREPVEAVVLDPPRSGLAEGVIDRVFGDVAPPRVVYVSCNPEALAADLPRISSSGYRVLRVQPVDMFPHTEHVETVVTLARG